MKITKPAILKDINSSKSVDDINRNQTIKDLQKEMDKRSRGKKDFTVIFVE